MPTIKEVLSQNGGNGFFFHRHAKYEVLGERPGQEPDECRRYARNYARVYPDNTNPLTQEGRDECGRQGKLLAELGIAIAQFATTTVAGRGNESAVYTATSYWNAVSERPLPVMTPEPDLSYLVYNEEICYESLKKSGNACVAEWLNGQWNGLCLNITPQDFKDKVLKMLQRYLKNQKGVTFGITHFEIVTLAHGLFSLSCGLGSVPEDWEPDYNTGILVVLENNHFQGYEYDKNFNVISS